MNNFLTFDIEDWYHSNFKGVDLSKIDINKTNFENNVSRLMDVCDKYGVKCTCFVVGSIAEKFPSVIRRIHDRGHEISSHTYSHKLVYSMSRNEFGDDLRKSKDILENIIGEPIFGFRAPSWSVKEENLQWYYETLEEEGFTYSSSVYPAKTFLYGIPGFKTNPHFPEIEGKQTSIIEFPVPVFNVMGKKIGFSGGFYLRALPGFLIEHILSSKNRKGSSTFVYLHPREIDTEQERLKLPIVEKLIMYWGIAGCEKKFSHIVEKFAPSFVRIKDYIKAESD
jgi:polysaccharide deacetylase family protein (PEP-CTERM system associated)